MAITDELREYARGCAGGMGGDALRHIADRIDREHRMALEKVAAEVDEEDRAEPEDAVDWKAEARTWERRCKELVVERDERYIALPLDADGVPWYRGSMVVVPEDPESRVYTVWIAGDNTLITDDHLFIYDANKLRHYHAQTVEDILDEFVERWMETHHDDIPALKAEYAAKLRRLVKECHELLQDLLRGVRLDPLTVEVMEQRMRKLGIEVDDA